jgi:LmbE family N-acetylglucosaminyl deacetylase
MRVLCLAAHPDDETIGAGGTLLKHRAAGDETALIVATVAFTPTWTESTIRRKREECEQAARLLGLGPVRFLDFPTMHLNALPAIELNAKVAAAIREFDPHVLYAPPFDDLNQDHAALFNAVNVAARHTGGSSLHALYSYEIPTTTRFNVASRWQANTYVDISEHIEAKLAAMEVYGTELRDPPHPRSLQAIRTFARERGAAMGVGHAESHMLVRRLA